MQTEFSCPFCQSSIPAADVNVATNLALCRTCGATSSFEQVAEPSRVSLDCLTNPPRWIRSMRNARQARRIVYRRVSLALLFLVPFTVAWSGFSMSAIYGTQIRKGVFDLQQSLFGLPFLLGTVVLLALIAFCAFGRWEVRLQ